nr:aldehyde dehydrogenase family protein [Bacillus piscicola]
MRTAVQRAKTAQKTYSRYTQEQVDKIVKHVANVAYKEAGSLAQLAVEETGMGVVEHKKIKNEVGSWDVYETIKDEKTVGVIREDRANKVKEIAYPFGVIAGIIPTTNPTSTAIFKTLISLKTRNAIVVSPHPRAVKCTIEALKICSQAAVEAGAPDGLVGWISKPTMGATNELMHHNDINLILATGGGGLVKAAYSSGKPAYGVGPGNVPVYIEKTANVKQAAKMIVDSKTFDNGTICATEQSIVVDQNVKEMSVRELKNNGAYFVNASEKAKLEDIISPIRGKLNPDIVGKPAKVIASMAGIEVPEDTRLLIAEEDKIAKDVPFSIEKLAPIFALYTARDADEAKELCIKLLDLGGRGHSFSIHTNDDKVADMYGEEMPVSRVMVNTLASVGAVGGTTGLEASMTLGCGSYGGNITGDNISARHLINIKRLAYGIKDVNIPQPKGNSGQESSSSAAKQDNVEEIVSEVMKNVNTTDNAVDPNMVSALVQDVLKKYQNQ